MIDQNHRVFRLKIDFSLPQEETPAPVQDRMSKLINQKLVQLMDEIFSEFSEPELNIKIDHLNLDLGKIDFDDFEKELPIRFEEKLRKQLLDLVQKPDLKKEILYQKRTQFRELELLDFYLRKGGFPWWKPEKLNKDYKKMFRQLVENKEHGLKEMFESLIGFEWPRKRIILSFDDQELKEIIKIIRPLNSKIIITYFDQIQTQHKKDPILKTDQKYFRNIHWALILKHLYERRGSEFNQKSFLKQILIGLATSFNIAYEELLFKLEKYLTQIASTTNRGNSFVQIIVLLANEKRTLSTKEMSIPLPSWTDDLLVGIPDQKMETARAWLSLINEQQINLLVLKEDPEVWLKLLNRLWHFDETKAIQFIRNTIILDHKNKELLARLAPQIIQKTLSNFRPDLWEELTAIRLDILQLAKSKKIPGWASLDLEKEINQHFLTYFWNGYLSKPGLIYSIKVIAEKNGRCLKSYLFRICNDSIQSLFKIRFSFLFSIGHHSLFENYTLRRRKE